MQPDEDPADPIQIARRIGEARRDAQSALDELDATPWPEMDLSYYMQATAVLDVVLRELLEALTAAATRPDSRATAATPTEVFSDDAEEETSDWLAWSVIRLAQERDDLVHLSELTAFDIVPGLSDVVAAFPSDFADLERFHILRAPMEELGGVSPLRWLVAGGDVQMVVTLVDDLGRDG